MAEPVLEFQVNEGSEGTPSWQTVDTALRFVGPGAAQESLAVPFEVPVADGDDAFFDNAADPNDGELWHEKAGASNDVQITLAGRNGNQNVLRVEETGTADATSFPPTLTAFDDSPDAAARTDPTLWALVGTSGTSNISILRAVETTAAAGSAGGWQAQVHDVDPQTTGTGVAADGFALDGDKAGERVVTASVHAASGVKTFNLAACGPHDATPGLSSAVIAYLYAYE